MQTTRKTWIAGASLVAILVVVAAWLLLIGPVRDEAATARDDAEQVEQSNDVLLTRVSALRKQYAEIDTYRDELATYQAQIPPFVDYESIVKEIERSVDKSKVALLSLKSEAEIEVVEPFTAIKKEKETTEDADGEKKDSKSEPTPTPTPTEIVTVSGEPPTETGALSEDISGFYQVPLALEVQGDYEEILKFSESLQVDSTRALLVSSIEITALREGPATSDAPATKVGDVSYTLHILAYVLQGDESKAKAGSDEDITEATLPAIGKKNVFAPER